MVRTASKENGTIQAGQADGIAGLADENVIFMVEAIEAITFLVLCHRAESRVPLASCAIGRWSIIIMHAKLAGYVAAVPPPI